MRNRIRLTVSIFILLLFSYAATFAEGGNRYTSEYFTFSMGMGIGYYMLTDDMQEKNSRKTGVESPGSYKGGTVSLSTSFFILKWFNIQLLGEYGFWESEAKIDEMTKNFAGVYTLSFTPLIRFVNWQNNYSNAVIISGGPSFVKEVFDDISESGFGYQVKFSNLNGFDNSWIEFFISIQKTLFKTDFDMSGLYMQAGLSFLIK